MSEIDEAKKRIEKRRKPLNDHNFKKLYNSMIRLMVMMIVVLGSLIVLKNPELEKNIFNGAHLQKSNHVFIANGSGFFTRRHASKSRCILHKIERKLLSRK